MAISDNTARFLGVSGVISMIGFAITLGRYEMMIEDVITRVDKLQHETVVLITSVNEMNVQRYRLDSTEKRLDSVEKRLDKLEGVKNAN